MAFKQAGVTLAAGVCLRTTALLLGGSVCFARQAAQAEQPAVAKQARDEARNFVNTGDYSHLRTYFNEIHIAKSADRALATL
jgi:hypothetical protein